MVQSNEQQITLTQLKMLAISWKTMSYTLKHSQLNTLPPGVAEYSISSLLYWSTSFELLASSDDTVRKFPHQIINLWPVFQITWYIIYRAPYEGAVHATHYFLLPQLHTFNHVIGKTWVNLCYRVEMASNAVLMSLVLWDHSSKMCLENKIGGIFYVFGQLISLKYCRE